MTLVLAFAGLVAFLLIKSEMKSRKWMKAFDLHNGMFDKYIELTKDLSVTDAQWREWLPIFEAADKICARDCPDMKFDPISYRIKGIIDGKKSIQD